MRRRMCSSKVISLALVLLLGGVSAGRTQAPSGAEAVRQGTSATAVPHGTLMIVGGIEDKSLRRRFGELAGVPDANVVCVPTALPHGRLSGWCRRFFRQAGVPKHNRTVLHTRNPDEANTTAFVEPLRTADAVWFTGGRQWRLVKAYAGTRTEAAFHDVLERGGVIGGTSAGASIQGSFLVRGDPKSKKIVVGRYTEGFGFLPHSAIDQHLRARNRENDLVRVVRERPKLLGLGIDENTAAIIRRDTLRVVGEGVVAVYDDRRINAAERQRKNGDSTSRPYVFLRPGDRFHLRTRTILRTSDERAEVGQ